MSADAYKINGRAVSKAEFDEYCRKRQEKFGNLFDDMVSSRCAPMMANSDRMFMEGAGGQSLTHGLNTMFPERLLERARKAGINTHGKVYMSQLGKAEDPRAWVSSIDDVRTSLKLQGKGSEKLGIKNVVPDPEPDIPLSEDIVREEFANRCASNPDLHAKVKENPEKARELREKIIEDHRYK